ncbi:MAG: ABC transporter substrate-binding protein [Ignavibacteriae bacterium]|nr:ABC transporter substrate-binding protein [Ignavibacteriota bacterium]
MEHGRLQSQLLDKHRGFIVLSNARILLALTFLLILLSGCTPKKGPDGSDLRKYVIIAVEGDVDSFNPLFAQEVTAGEINDLFFPGLMDARFDTSKGELAYYPMLATSWEFNNNNRDIVFHLRTDAQWADGNPVTARDVQLSYELYGDTAVASIRQSSVERLRKREDGDLDVHGAVEAFNDSTVIFHFEDSYPGQLFDVGLPILPVHIFEKLQRRGLREDPINRNPMSCGSFILKSWKPMQEIVLESNQRSKVPYPAKLSQLIFRVIPDYRSRLAQLRSGEVDIVEDIRLEDAVELETSSPHIQLHTLGERFYDAINWNNIDQEKYRTSGGKTIRPHPLFGSSTVRRALTLAINRREIVQSYLKSYGREAIGPISPLFRWAYNDTLQPLPYDPVLAKHLLAEEGWRDSNGDGVLDKNGRKFEFALKITAGNQLRSTIASIVQHQLSALKISMKIEQVERSVFWPDLMEKKYDAFIAGFYVPLQMQLDELWGSDLNRSPFNLVSFRNKRVDEILRGAKRVAKETDHASAWKEFQEILYREQPCTFLYWMNSLVGINKRVRGTTIGVLGLTHHAWEWYVDETDIKGKRK